MGNGVISARATGTGTLVATRRGRLKAIHWVAAAAAGTLTFRDGGAGGTTILVIDTPASATSTGTVDIPGDGILFGTDLHVTFSNVFACTVLVE